MLKGGARRVCRVDRRRAPSDEGQRLPVGVSASRTRSVMKLAYLIVVSVLAHSIDAQDGNFVI